MSIGITRMKPTAQVNNLQVFTTAVQDMANLGGVGSSEMAF